MAFRLSGFMSVVLMFSTISTALAERNLTRPPGTTRYAGMVDKLNDLAKWDQTQGFHRLQLSSIGDSVKGRSLWMVTLHNADSPSSGNRILYICRQHGHEPASTEGALQFVDELVHSAPSSDLGQCLSKTTVYIIPMMNPDGAERYLRHNAHDVDLNRDWLTRTQPETRAVWRAIEMIHPDLITDQHELFPDDHRPDFTETAGPKAGAAESVTWFCESAQQVVHLAMTADGFPNRSYQIDTPHRPHLVHKFGCTVLGIPTILFETNRSTPSRTVADRGEAQAQFMRIILREEAGEQDTLLSEAYSVLGTRTIAGLKPQPALTTPNTSEPPASSSGPPGSDEDNQGQ